jgi:peptide/nickel transport system substrate-binding protein
VWLARVVIAFGIFACPAFAQKSADTLRFAITDAFSSVDPIHFPHDESNPITRATFETLIEYDEHARRYAPRLAKSWKRIDDRTIEFELRDDVLFHNGDKFDAADVKYIVEYASAPETRLRFKEHYSWIEQVEILDPYRIRIHAKQPQSNDMVLLAYRVRILDSKVLSKMENKADYGRGPSTTTGPYRVVSVDPAKGVVLERFERYYDKSGAYRAPIKRLVGIPIPDRQTQLAQFMTGNIDLMRDVPADMARQMTKLPNAKVTVTSSGTVIYTTLDAAGRSANKAMTDPRVRRAFAMAIDRKLLAATVIPGGDESKVLDAICIPSNIDCAVTVKPPAYDLAGAKKLLAEAGHGNGVDIEINVYNPIREVG